jgi:hypothetical protein
MQCAVSGVSPHMDKNKCWTEPGIISYFRGGNTKKTEFVLLQAPVFRTLVDFILLSQVQCSLATSRVFPSCRVRLIKSSNHDSQSSRN